MNKCKKYNLKIQKKIKQKVGGNNHFKILVESSDKKKIYISNKILNESMLIKNILQDLGHINQVIPLYNISEKILNIIDNDIHISDFDTLKEIASAANYLEMDSYLDNITTRIANILKQKIK